MDETVVYLQIPLNDWYQIKSDIENMAGGEAEVLANVRVLKVQEPSQEY